VQEKGTRAPPLELVSDKERHLRPIRVPGVSDVLAIPHDTRDLIERLHQQREAILRRGGAEDLASYRLLPDRPTETEFDRVQGESIDECNDFSTVSCVGSVDDDRSAVAKLKKTISLDGLILDRLDVRRHNPTGGETSSVHLKGRSTRVDGPSPGVRRTTGTGGETPPEIRVNAVAPGSTDTPGAQAATGPTAPAGATLDDLLNAFLARIPLGRMGIPEDIAMAVINLASPASSYVTGATLAVDGGYLVL
jgi:Enoyl-(Acyl carrier protein) reductase